MQVPTIPQKSFHTHRIHRNTQTLKHTATHSHTQPHTDTHRHTQTHTDTHRLQYIVFDRQKIQTATERYLEGEESTHLIGVVVEVKVLEEARSELTEQGVVCLVDGPHAPVGVVVGTGAGTECSHWGIRGRTTGLTTN
jgi:hypothetical protein